jgi:hypothetical protein
MTADRDAKALDLANMTADLATANASSIDKTREATELQEKLDVKTIEVRLATEALATKTADFLQKSLDLAKLEGKQGEIEKAKEEAEVKTKEVEAELLKSQQEVVKMKGEAEAKAEVERQAQLEEERRNSGVAAFRKWASGSAAMKAALISYVLANAEDETLLADACPSLVGLLADRTVGGLAQQAIGKLPPTIVKYVAREVGSPLYIQKNDFTQKGIVEIGEVAIPELLKVAVQADEANSVYLQRWAVTCMALIRHNGVGKVMLENATADRDVGQYAAAALKQEEWIIANEKAIKEKSRADKKSEAEEAVKALQPQIVVNFPPILVNVPPTVVNVAPSPAPSVTVEAGKPTVVERNPCTGRLGIVK